MISREEQQQAMKKLKRMISELKADTATFNHPLSRQLVHTLSVAVDCLEIALSQPERPKGRWICVYDEMMGETEVTCSHCKDTRTIKGCYVSHDGESIYYDDNFCPNCGSDNRGEEE